MSFSSCSSNFSFNRFHDFYHQHNRTITNIVGQQTQEKEKQDKKQETAENNQNNKQQQRQQHSFLPFHFPSLPSLPSLLSFPPEQQRQLVNQLFPLFSERKRIRFSSSFSSSSPLPETLSARLSATTSTVKSTDDQQVDVIASSVTSSSSSSSSTTAVDGRGEEGDRETIGEQGEERKGTDVEAAEVEIVLDWTKFEKQLEEFRRENAGVEVEEEEGEEDEEEEQEHEREQKEKHRQEEAEKKNERDSERIVRKTEDEEMKGEEKATNKQTGIKRIAVDQQDEENQHDASEQTGKKQKLINSLDSSSPPLVSSLSSWVSSAASTVSLLLSSPLVTSDSRLTDLYRCLAPLHSLSNVQLSLYLDALVTQLKQSTSLPSLSSPVNENKREELTEEGAAGGGGVVWPDWMADVVIRHLVTADLSSTRSSIYLSTFLLPLFLSLSSPPSSSVNLPSFFNSIRHVITLQPTASFNVLVKNLCNNAQSIQYMNVTQQTVVTTMLTEINKENKIGDEIAEKQQLVIQWIAESTVKYQIGLWSDSTCSLMQTYWKANQGGIRSNNNNSNNSDTKEKENEKLLLLLLDVFDHLVVSSTAKMSGHMKLNQLIASVFVWSNGKRGVENHLNRMRAIANAMGTYLKKQALGIIDKISTRK